MEKLKQIITEQQKGHEDKPRFMIGEQLLEIAEKEELSRELLKQDLIITEMNLEAAEKHFQDYANKNRGGSKVFCITPKTAENLLRKFYGLPVESNGSKKENNTVSDFIDLTSFF